MVSIIKMTYHVTHLLTRLLCRYYSGIIIDGKSLECTWIDSDGTAPGDVTGIQVHLPEFNDKGQGYNNDTN